MMKKLLFLLLLLPFLAGAQTNPAYLRYDSVYLMKGGTPTAPTGNSELIILNSTRDTLGFLKNIRKGRTEFVIPHISDIVNLQDSLLSKLTSRDSLTINGVTKSLKGKPQFTVTATTDPAIIARIDSEAVAIGAKPDTSVTRKLNDSVAVHRTAINKLNDSIAVHRTAINTNTAAIGAKPDTSVTRKLNDSVAVHRTAINKLNDSIAVHRTAINDNTAAIAQNNVYSDFVNILNYGADSTGVTESTTAFQSAVATGKNVYVPGGKFLISVDIAGSGGITLKSNQRIVMSARAYLFAKTNALASTQMFRFNDVENSSIEGGNIYGDTAHTGGSSQQSNFLIAVLGGKNITIRNVNLKRSWDDAITINRSTTLQHPEKITIDNVRIDSCRRMGISVYDVRSLQLNNVFVFSTKGTAPEAAMNVLPATGDTAMRINISNWIFGINTGNGLMVGGTGNIQHINVSNGMSFKNSTGAYFGRNAKDLHIQNVVADSSVRESFFQDSLYPPVRITYNNCIASNSGEDNFALPGYGTLIENCYSFRAGKNGMYLFGSGKVTNNIIDQSGRVGMRAYTFSNSEISHNTVKGSSQSSNLTYSNISFETSSSRNLITMNSIRQDTFANKPAYGIIIDASSDSNKIIDPYYNGGGGATGDYTSAATHTYYEPLGLQDSVNALRTSKQEKGLTASKGLLIGDSEMASWLGQMRMDSLLLNGADTTIGNTIKNQAVGGNTILQQQTIFLADANRATYNWILVHVGLNDVWNQAEAASVALARYQTLINNIKAQNPSAVIIVAAMQPVRRAYWTNYSNANAILCYNKWFQMNQGIMGTGPNPITGVDYRVDEHSYALADGIGNLASIYNVGDDIHDNNLGRRVVADIFRKQINAAGFLSNRFYKQPDPYINYADSSTAVLKVPNLQVSGSLSAVGTGTNGTTADSAMYVDRSTGALKMRKLATPGGSGDVVASGNNTLSGTNNFSGQNNFTSTGTLLQYNTSDQTTNTEYGKWYWNSNVYTLDVNKTGTGTLRNMVFNANNATITLGNHSIANAALDITKTGTNLSTLSIRGVNTLASGVFSANAIYPTINQSGSASYVGLFMAPYEQTLGSGTNYFIRLMKSATANAQGAYTDYFGVKTNGDMYTFGGISAINLGTNGTTADSAMYVDRSTGNFAMRKLPSSTSPVWGTITGTLSDQTDLQNAFNLKAPINNASLTGVTYAAQLGVGFTSGIGAKLHVKNNSSSSSNIGAWISGASTASAGTNTALALSPTWNGSGTSGHIAFFISAYPQSVGSGPNWLMRVGTNTASDVAGTHRDKLTLDTSGNLAIAGSFAFNNGTDLANALAGKAPLASPALTGTPTVPTATAGTNNTQAASTAYADNAATAAASGKAPTASPTFTGTPTVPNLNFTGVSAPTTSQGKLVYDTDNETLTFFNNEPDFSLQVGQETVIRVRNNTGSTILNGKAVYINGSHSDGTPTIALAQSNAGTTTIVAGLATHDIENNTYGYITSIGIVHGLNTAAYSAGQTLYLSSTSAGDWATSAPVYPNYRYRLGIVTKSNSTSGSIHVTPSTGDLGMGGANQLRGMKADGLTQEYKTLSGTTNEIAVTHSVGGIQVGLASSPALSGTPTAPTKLPNDNSTSIATTAYVDSIRAMRLVAVDNTQHALTGSTTETTALTLTIPANAISANGSYTIVTLFSMNNSAGTKTVRWKMNGTTIWSVGPTTQLAYRAMSVLSNRNSQTSQITGGASNATAGLGLGGSAHTVQTFSINTGAAVTLTVTMQLSTGTDNMAIESIQVYAAG